MTTKAVTVPNKKITRTPVTAPSAVMMVVAPASQAVTGSPLLGQSHDSGVSVGQMLMGQVIIGHGVGSSQVGLVGGGSVLEH